MLPETTKQRIEQEAETFRLKKLDTGFNTTAEGQKRAYAIGAIAYAKKAQRLADALEEITTAKRLPDEENDTYKANRMWHIAVNALQKWRGEK